jgi:hypothetical protein
MTTIHMHHDIATDVGRKSYWESTSRSPEIIQYSNAKIVRIEINRATMLYAMVVI